MNKEVKCKKSGEMINNECITVTGCSHGDCKDCPFLTNEQRKIEKVNYNILKETK